jgi:hypothetical protein
MQIKELLVGSRLVGMVNALKLFLNA